MDITVGENATIHSEHVKARDNWEVDPKNAEKFLSEMDNKYPKK